jgi:PiT family inorganic phosphate transporter
MQLVSAAIYSLAHGGNDAQKTMGIIVLLLTAANRAHWAQSTHKILWHEHNVALWVILSCHAAIALGTMFGGWRIVKTMGSGITRLAPVGGFCAETAAAATIIGATRLGIPISTTHAITGAILGVGTTKGVRSVRWIWGQRIVIAWILTLPCSALMAAVTYWMVHFLGIEITLALMGGGCLAIWLWKRRQAAAEAAADANSDASVTTNSSDRSSSTTAAPVL